LALAAEDGTAMPRDERERGGRHETTVHRRLAPTPGRDDGDDDPIAGTTGARTSTIAAI